MLEKGFFVCDKFRKRIGKVIDINNKLIKVQFFYSLSKQMCEWIPAKYLTKINIDRQTRCYYYSSEQQRWMMGRIIKKVGQEYEVEFPDKHSTYLDEGELFVRVNEPIENPMEILEVHGQETTFFNTRRSQFVHALLEQRSISRGMTGLLSSNILLLPHQVEVARRVLEDPVQRYLLADEVGLGKTIEAGIILRQYLLDHPDAKALIIVPPFLLNQWKKELQEKFYLNRDPFAKQIHWLTTDELKATSDINKQYGMVIVDEAHDLTVKAYSQSNEDQEVFQILRDISQHTQGLLLLSATPVLNNERSFLSMLHLLDPEYYRLEDLDHFKFKVEKRQEIGHLLLQFHEENSPFSLKLAMKRMASHFPEDNLLQDMLEELQMILSTPQNKQEERIALIRRIRVHLSNTYRLHRRLLRNRRELMGDVLVFSRGQEQFDSKSIHEEYDLDERSDILEQYLEEWRMAAWASEKEVWEQLRPEGTALSKLFILLLETSGSAPRLFQEVIQCRLHGERLADLSMDLSEQQIELLVKTPYFPGEKEILKRIFNLLDLGSEFGDKVELIDQLVSNLKRRSERNESTLPKIVVFTTYPSVCKEITKKLRWSLGHQTVVCQYLGMDKQTVEKEIERFISDSQCFVLVCDRTGEEGRNLQFADLIIHFDLPFSPNRIEQRIGRLDRIGRHTPFSIYVFVGTVETDNSLHAAWFRLLYDGFQVFHSSISMFQFYIEDQLPVLQSRLFSEGITNLDNMIEDIQKELLKEQNKILEQDALDVIDLYEQGTTDFYSTLYNYDIQYEKIKQRMEPWICEALKINKYVLSSNYGTFYYTADMGTLVPLRYLMPLAETLRLPHTYDRSVSVRTASCILMRIGENFLDQLADYIRWDDRGQAFAFWRCVPGWPTEEGTEKYVFCFNYVIEGDTDPAEWILKKNGSNNANLKALQRRLDRYFPPQYKTIHVDIEGNLVDDPQILKALEPPFFKQEEGGYDLNLIKDRLVFFEQFDTNSWKDSCRLARHSSEQLLRGSQKFQQICQEYADQAARDLELGLTQMMLRAKQDQVLFYQKQLYRKELQLEQKLNQAIVKGTRHPKVRLDSVGFIALSGRKFP